MAKSRPQTHSYPFTSVTMALQRTTFEITLRFELQAGGLDPQQYREQSLITWSYLQ